MLLDVIPGVILGVQVKVDQMLQVDRLSRRIEVPAEIIDEANCRDWDRPYAERPLPDWESSVVAFDYREARD